MILMMMLMMIVVIIILLLLFRLHSLSAFPSPFHAPSSGKDGKAKMHTMNESLSTFPFALFSKVNGRIEKGY